jgi:hypothetical protein
MKRGVQKDMMWESYGTIAVIVVPKSDLDKDQNQKK